MSIASKIAASVELVLAGLGSDASRRGYRSDWESFTAWLSAEGLTVLKVTPQDVKRYVVHLVVEKKAKGTRGRHLSTLRQVYRGFVDDGLLETNPARETKNPTHGGTKRTPWFEEADLAKLLAWRGDGSWRDRRDRMCILLLAGTGWRRAEVARMKVEDFRGDYVTGIVKRGKEETGAVPKWLQVEIAAWCEHAGIQEGPILLRSPMEGRLPVNGSIVYLIVRRVGVAVGLPKEQATPHALRRTLATLAERRGVALKDIQQQLGHGNLSTTEGYLKGSRAMEHAPSEWMKDLVK